jgi:carbonic anhydrase
MDAWLHNGTKLAGLPAVGAWLKRAGDLRRPDGPNALRELIEQNVLTQIGNLRTYPSVSKRERNGKLLLHGWVYDIPTGVVCAWDPALGKFGPIEGALARTVSEPA